MAASRASPGRQYPPAPAIEKRRIRSAEIVPDLGAAYVDGFLVPLAPRAVRNLCGETRAQTAVQIRFRSLDNADHRIGALPLPEFSVDGRQNGKRRSASVQRGRNEVVEKKIQHGVSRNIHESTRGGPAIT